LYFLIFEARSVKPQKTRRIILIYKNLKTITKITKKSTNIKTYISIILFIRFLYIQTTDEWPQQLYLVMNLHFLLMRKEEKESIPCKV